MKSIKSKIIILILALVFVSSGLAVSFGVVKSMETTDIITKDLYLSQLDGAGNIFASYMKEYFGEFQLDEQNQLIDENGQRIDNQFEYLDQFSKDMNMVATIFGKTGDDFTRIITSIKDEKGNRVVGTVLDPLGAAYKELITGKSYLGEANILGKNYVTKYIPILNQEGKSIGIYFVGIPFDEVTKTIDEGQTKVITSLLVIIGVLMVLSTIASYLIGDSISKPFLEITKVIVKQSSLDFSKDEKLNISRYLKRKDEIGRTVYALQNMEDCVRVFIQDTKSISKQVESSSEVLTSLSLQAASTAEEVAQTINDIATGATEQAGSTVEGSSKLLELGVLIKEDKRHIDQMESSISTVSQMVNEGLRIVEELSEKTKANSMAAGVVYESILKTNSSSGKISDASNLIASIAQQTNLLALNAAIEAARAGEFGKGFAVVADEIRKLAEQSTTSTKNIDEMVNTLKADAEIAVEKMEEAGIIVQKQEESVQLTEKKYMEIAQAMKETQKAILTLTQSSRIMEVRNNEAQEVIQILTAVAEENAASTQESSASIQEQTNAIEDISNSSEGLLKLAIELKTSIDKFKV